MVTEINVGEKTLTLVSNASTAYRFKQAFGIDLLRILSNTRKTPIDDGQSVDLALRLAYVMAHQATKELDRLNEEDFYEWLEGYEVVELEHIETIIKIWDAYTGQTKGDSEPKKKSVRQKEK